MSGYKSERLKDEDIIAVLDLDSATEAFTTRSFLRECEKKGILVSLSRDIPRSIIVTESLVYLSGISAKTIIQRLEGALYNTLSHVDSTLRG